MRKARFACMVLLFWGCIIVVFMKWEREKHTFFDILGFATEDVSRISLSYQDYTVYLTESQKKNLLDMLDAAEMDGTARENNRPFQTSPYKLKIWTDEEYPVEICWFDGMAFDLDANSGAATILDDRFDVKLNSKWYTFRQTSETRWNSFVLQDMFDTLAMEQDVDVPSKYELDGYDGEIVKYNDYPKGYNCVRMSADEIMETADYIIVGVFLRNEEMDKDTYLPLSSKQIICVKEVLKGSLNVGDEISIFCDFYELLKDDMKWIAYTHEYDPMMVMGEEYLLCLSYETGWGTEDKPYGIYVIEGGVYGSAIVVDEYTYPRFNTEYHPFFECSLNELRLKCDG